MALSLVLVYSLLAALSWGISDFSGGIATKRLNVLFVLVISQILGLLSLIIIVNLSGEDYKISNIFVPLIAGILGGIGLISLYRGLAVGKISIVAPLSAVISASIPVLFSFINEGIPTNLHLLGLFIALIAIYLLSSENSNIRNSKEINSFCSTNMAHGLVSGISFGLFFVLIDQFDSGSIFWPLILLRISSISFFLVLIVILKVSLPSKSISVNPSRYLGLIFVAGIGDTVGNVLFTLATQSGRLDIAAMLSSLFPLTTIILARIIFKERIELLQKIGIASALIAILFLSLS